VLIGFHKKLQLFCDPCMVNEVMSRSSSMNLVSFSSLKCDEI
jgi:hypothetical protein